MKKGLKKSGVGIFIIALSTLIAFTALAQERNTIRLGYLAELTGFIASYGIDEYAGVRYAVSAINDAGGIRIPALGKSFKIEFIVEDTRSSPPAAISAAEKTYYK